MDNKSATLSRTELVHKLARKLARQQAKRDHERRERDDHDQKPKK